MDVSGIHLATAQALEQDLRAVVTNDERMAAAARSAGLRVASPR